MFNPIEDVYHFQTRVLENEFPDKPTKLDGKLKYEQIEKLEEEIYELKTSGSISDQADAILDLVYFAYGILHMMGVDTQRVWDEIHRANMSKKRGLTKRGHDNDAAKPEDWKAPDHSWLDQ